MDIKKECDVYNYMVPDSCGRKMKVAEVLVPRDKSKKCMVYIKIKGRECILDLEDYILNLLRAAKRQAIK